MAKENLKLPPQDLDAELSVLGALMIDKNAVIRVADFLEAGDFYKPVHQKIYQSALQLFEKNEPIDLLSVAARLKENGVLDEVGGMSYLSEVINSVPSASNAEHYGKIVKEKSLLRGLIRASAEINEEAFKEGDVETLIDSVEQKIFNLTQRSTPQRLVPLRDELLVAYQRIEKLHLGGGSLRGVPPGFDGLDVKLSGLQKSDLIILGARPSLGKTTLALDIARNAATKHKIPVGIFSLEMSKDQVIDRLIAAEAQIPLWRLRTGKISDEELQMISNFFDKLSEAPIYIDDTPSPTILQIKSVARRLQIEEGLELIIIDYLQLVQPRTHSDNMVHQVTEISRGLKMIARELNTPVLALSQLSRGVEQRDTKIPRLSDLRESGSLEQDSDVVLFIYRKDRDKQEVSLEEQNLAEIIIAKHRNGPLGTVQLKFDPEKVTFMNMDKVHEPDNFNAA